MLGGRFGRGSSTTSTNWIPTCYIPCYAPAVVTPTSQMIWRSMGYAPSAPQHSPVSAWQICLPDLPLAQSAWGILHVRKIAPTNTKRCARKCLVFLLIVQVALVKGSSALQIQLKRIHSISSSALELLQTPRSASETKSAVSNLLNFLLFRWVSGERLWRVSHCSRAWRPSLSAPHDLSTEP